MGCGSSKIQDESQPPNIPLQASRSRPATNAQSRRGPPPGTAGGRRGTRPPSLAGTRSQSRVPSQAGSKAPSRRGTAGTQSAHRRRQQDRRYSSALGAIPYEQPPEDRAIRDEIRAFRLYIDQHAINFYHTHRDSSGTLIAAYIARRIIEKVIYGGGTRDRDVAEHLSSALAKYAKDSVEERRNEHLIRLCNMGRTIRDMRERHPSEWIFVWDGGGDMVFPRVMRNGEEVLEATYDN